MSEPLTHASDLESIRACVEARCLLVPAQATALLAALAASREEADRAVVSHWECGNCGREWVHDPEPTETLFCRSGGGAACADYAVTWKNRAELAEARLTNAHELEQLHRRHLRAARDERDAAREQLAAMSKALAHLRAYLMRWWFREDESEMYSECRVCDSSGPSADFLHHEGCVLDAAILAAASTASTTEDRL